MVELALHSSSWCFLRTSGRCDHKCRSPCEWRDHIRIWSLALTKSSSSLSDRDWRSWCRPKLSFSWWTQWCVGPFPWVVHQELPQKALVSPFSHHIVEMCLELLVESPESLELIPLRLRTLSPLTNNWCDHLPQWHWQKNSLMISSNTSAIRLSNFVHVLSLNTSGMKVPSSDSKSTVYYRTIGAHL